MKKTLLAVALTGAIISTPTFADTLLGVYAGAQAWNMETEGGFANNDSLASFSFEDETKTSYYVAFEHPVPFIPNVKVRQTDMDTSGVTTLSSTFTFGGQLFSNQSDLQTEIDVSNTDFIAYFEIFDNDLVSFDFGLNGKYVDGSLYVQDAGDNSINAREEFSGVVPMLYSRLEFGLPGTGFSVYAEGSYLAVDDHTLSDYEAAITYDFVENMAIDMTAQVGYRSMTLELEDLDDIYSNLEFSGVYAGIEVHF